MTGWSSALAAVVPARGLAVRDPDLNLAGFPNCAAAGGPGDLAPHTFLSRPLEARARERTFFSSRGEPTRHADIFSQHSVILVWSSSIRPASPLSGFFLSFPLSPLPPSPRGRGPTEGPPRPHPAPGNRKRIWTQQEERGCFLAVRSPSLFLSATWRCESPPRRLSRSKLEKRRLRGRVNGERARRSCAKIRALVFDRRRADRRPRRQCCKRGYGKGG